jgi:hypothetical protein
MLLSLWSDWFSTLVFADQFRFRMAAFAANDAFQKAEASGRHIRTKIVT